MSSTVCEIKRPGDNSMNIGIDDNLNLIYESTGAWGYALWPPPFLFPCNIQSVLDKEIWPVQVSPRFEIKYLFREDSFDPVSRIRRGRLYRRTLQQQPSSWHVYPHPALQGATKRPNKDDVVRRDLITFESFRLEIEVPDLLTLQPLFVLGTTERFTLWTLVSIEGIAGGEEMVVLRSRQTFGSLPRILMENIPELRRTKVMEMLNKVSEEVYKSGPESVIDCCRDAASAILGAYFNEDEKDLGPLVKKLSSPPDHREVSRDCADLVRLFHARAKPSEQAKRKPRPITEQDAELAVQCLGTLLCELGWARWL